MSEVILHLDGCKMDIDPKTSVSETKQINDIFKLDDRQTSFTNSFEILLTKSVKEDLKRVGDTYNDSEKPYRNLKANITRGGTPTIIQGIAEITEIKERNKAKINIQDGNVSIFKDIEGKDLSGLNYAGVSHIFNNTNIADSFVHTWEDGYIYAIAEYGLTDTSNVDFKYNPPALFVKWLWEKIWEESDYTYSYRGLINPLESEDFKSKLISLNNGLSIINDPTPSELKVELIGTNTINEDGRQYIAMSEVFDPDGFHSITSSPNSNESLITPTSNNNYEIQVTGSLTGTALIVVELNNNTMLTIDPSASINENTFSYLSVNDSIKIYSEGTGSYDYNINLKIYKNNNNNVVNFNSFLSNIKQKDFFKYVIQTYGLIFQREKGTNNYEFITIEEMFTDRQGSVDYSDKYNDIINEKPKFGNFNQLNFFRYKYDDDGADFSDGSFRVDNQNLNDEGTLITNPFKAPKITGEVLSGNTDNVLIYEMLLYSINRNDDGTIKDVKAKSGTPYIFNLGFITGTLNFIGDQQGAIINSPIPYGNFENLNYNEIIANNYSSYIKTMNRIKFYTVEMKFNSIDILNFDFLKLVYLSQFQRYFYCNKIKSFKNNKVTKVELIEVNTSRQTTGEYSDDYSRDYNI